jgi:hypothetical protein
MEIKTLDFLIFGVKSHLSKIKISIRVLSVGAVLLNRSFSGIFYLKNDPLVPGDTLPHNPLFSRLEILPIPSETLP